MQKKEPPYKRKLMHLTIDTHLGVSALRNLLVMLFALYLSGCAARPWSETLDPDQVDETLRVVDTLAIRDAKCPQTLSGDLTLFYKSPVDNTALNGFLQFSLPSSYKFVLTNPFGQPLFAVAGDQKSYSGINTQERKYFSGGLHSFGVRYNIDDAFLQGNWGDWLTGRNHFSGQDITDLRNDRSNRGVWLTLAARSDGRAGSEHLLLAPEEKLYLARIVEDWDNKVVAEITYGEWTGAGNCLQPLDILITGLAYGAEIHLKLSDIVFDDGPQKYSLQVPAGYIKQYMP